MPCCRAGPNSRAAPGEDGGEQIVAANIDTVFLVTALDDNYSLRRIERYLAVAWESGAQPVVVLNNADLQPNPAALRAEVESAAGGAPVLALSAAHDAHLDLLAPWLESGRTVALLGSSGVGKSTLINRLLGTPAAWVTGEISAAHGKGRHTTTHRELLRLPSGALVIDTPGMRELQFWDVGADMLDEAFTDVAMLIAACRFSDCSHRTEPGCAVQAALDNGTLEAGRWASYLKLQREQASRRARRTSQLARETKAARRKIPQGAARCTNRQKKGLNRDAPSSSRNHATPLHPARRRALPGRIPACIRPHPRPLRHAGTDAVADAPKKEMTVIVDGERIAAVQAGYAVAGPGDTVIDLKSATVTPGWIDCHVHLDTVTSPQSTTEKFFLNPGDYALRAWPTALKLTPLLAGFTTVRNLG